MRSVLSALAFVAIALLVGHGQEGITPAPSRVTVANAQLPWAETPADSINVGPGVENNASVPGMVVDENPWGIVKKTLYRLWIDTLRALPLLFVGVLVLGITAVVASFARRFVRYIFHNRPQVRANFADLVVQLTSLCIWVIGITFAAVIAFPGVTPSKALTLLGLGSVAIGFAFKDIFENFFAGVLILWRYPFDRGDVIQVGDVMGRVQTISVRNTIIMRPSGELVVVPNATMFKTNVEILTYTRKRRTRLTCGIAYTEDLETAIKVIAQGVNACKTVDFESPVEVVACAFSESSVDIEVLWWAGAEPKQERASRSEVIVAIKKALDEAKIEIPLPYRNLLVYNQTSISEKESREVE